ncbi:putative pseudouridine synthase [Triangularia setosa]|uniref:Pseudouridine synthase n=1 Tax=Triangularia setosa TaxID=2587417 RepID=A0AAN6WH56_9PEZI|nr:putative pseudouridine synthase [Podospora setosa]
MAQRPNTHLPAVRLETEKNLGITHRSAALNFAWTGDIRKRYTDFLVYEININGTVVHLHDYIEDKPATSPTESQLHNKSAALVPTPAGPRKQENKGPPVVHQIPEGDQQKLIKLIGETTAKKLIEVDSNVQRKVLMSPENRTVVFDPIDDRSQRAEVHQEIRRIFNSRVETVANSMGIITATPSKWAVNRGNNNNRNPSQAFGPRRDNNNNRQDRNVSFAKLGGEYLHLTLYKENKDTMDAINTIARLLKIKATNFGFAGTKDRRAATVQRISIRYQRASNLTWLNTRIPNVKVGDFEHKEQPLSLGQHGGNEFIITLKNCHPLGGNECSVAQRIKMIQQTVECGLAYLKHNGYINYFGLQRFGTHTIGTHLLGMKILQGDFEGVIDAILHVDDHYIQEAFNHVGPSQGTKRDFDHGHGTLTSNGNNANNANRDDYERARAITIWKTSKNATKAVEILPKRFSSEIALIRHLGKNSKDFTGAILSITRSMRMMYIHAFQSYVWNHVASRRWSKYGARVIEGDIVLNEDAEDAPARFSDDEDLDTYDDNEADRAYPQAHVVTAEDLASEKYTIFDVVLPTPGYDVIYPQNEIGEYYAEFMGKEENGSLDPYDMRRKNREFSLSGSYRALMGRFITEPQYAIRAYVDDTEQMYPTDLDFATHKKAQQKKALPQPKPASQAANSWNAFAANPTAFDDALAEFQRRRKVSEEPASDVKTVIKETWVETGVDGSAKRVKIARHQQEIESQPETQPETLSKGPSDPELQARMKAMLFPGGIEAATVAPQEDVSMVDAQCPPTPARGPAFILNSPPVGKGVSLLDSQSPVAEPAAPLEQKPSLPSEDGGLAISKDPNASGPRGISDTFYALGGDDPFAARASSTTTLQQATESSSAVKSEPSEWYGKELTGLLGNSTAEIKAEQQDSVVLSTSQALVKVEDDGKPDPSVVELINGVPLPKFHTASNNPLLSPKNIVDVNSLDPRARKIAVILKFQLKTSNYATIVLRELMGTTVE